MVEHCLNCIFSTVLSMGGKLNDTAYDHCIHLRRLAELSGKTPKFPSCLGTSLWKQKLREKR